MNSTIRKISIAIKWIGILLFMLFTTALFIASLPYALFTTIYDFPERTPFRESTWFNPYEHVSFDDISAWKTTNFHGHTKAWGTMTDGHSDHLLYDSVYRALGYHTPGISNYQFIDTTFRETTGYVPCYEHGYNLWKRHHVCIGAKSVTWLDFIFGQSIHHKQTMLDHIKSTVEVLAIAHPTFRGSFDPEDFSLLASYDCIEVLNHYRISEPQWDSALSSGYPAWIVGNDDTHNALSEGETGVCWTNIFAPGSANGQTITSSLKQGKAFGVTGTRAKTDIRPIMLHISNQDTLHIEVNKKAAKVELIGQSGKVLRRDTMVQQLSYRLQSTDTYVRAKIYGDSCTLWMNPIMRGNGDKPSGPIPNMAKTYTYRGMWWIAYVLIAFTVFRMKRRKN